MSCFLRLACCLVALTAIACGGRTDLRDQVDAEGIDGPVPGDEVCNGLDDDLDGNVDEDFRDELGRYLNIDHCGGCGMPCGIDDPQEVRVDCILIEEAPVCAALECTPGFAPSRSGECVPLFDQLCMTCLDDGDCGGAAIAHCDEVASERRCTVECTFGCPDGYSCQGDRCIPLSGSCSCGPGDFFDLACTLYDPMDQRCPGAAVCTDGLLSECEAPPEVCDEEDNDCDGDIDEGFRDRRGAYSLDIRNCGQCGVDCTVDMLPEGDLVCGGDPFAPSCVLECPDTLDGIQVGDRIDADLDIATGCECTLTSFTDEPGPVFAVGEDLDVNCDGADGVVVNSVYVAPDGDDAFPGSPTRPVKTLARGLEIARESLGTDEPRDHIFVASGSYAETLELTDGLLVHGGYRRDFLALDPAGFRVDVRAPASTTAPGGAAFVARNVGTRRTRLRWMTFIGRDSTPESAAAFGGVVLTPGGALELLDLQVLSGQAASGLGGTSGERGQESTRPAAEGELPRGAIENASNLCIRDATNTVAGGTGGVNQCDGVNVGGGRGGSPSCPTFANEQPAGVRGQGAAPGGGGRGGQDSRGPISGFNCPGGGVCCGLADFSVPTEFVGPQSGVGGGDGNAGRGGSGCSDPFGRFDGTTWTPIEPTRGSAGTAGSGGGGGGAGGGAEMDFVNFECGFADGLGGGGGGGGSGGGGGGGGTPGGSGGPAVAVGRGLGDVSAAV
ncbi:MAG: hypothetical protein AB8H86_33975, partial [Polyangiales bacterium]